jgi:hypothetical protein
MRILDRVAHAGLRRQVHDAPKRSRANRLCMASRSVMSAFTKRKPGALQNLQARGFQARIVVGVEIVEPDHLIAALEQQRCAV